MVESRLFTVLSLLLLLQVDNVVGWTTNKLVFTRTSQTAQQQRLVQTKLHATNDRRNFLNDIAIKAVAGAVVVGVNVVSAVSPAVVNAIETVSSSTSTTGTGKIDYKYYTPEPNSLKDEIIVITGGSTGLGLESAKRLAYGGATVIITSRTEQKGNAALQQIKEYLQSKNDIVNKNKLYTVQLDLDNLDNVRSFPNRLQSTIGTDKKITILLNNAGVMAIPTREITIDGNERTFQSNHLGHFLLTNKLMPLFKTSGTNNVPPRIINVSSEAHKFAANGLQLDNINGEINYTPWGSYGQSKLANVLFTKELQDRANAAGKSLVTVTLHPGAVQTDLGRYIIGVDKYDTMKSSNGESMSFIEKGLLGLFSKFVLTVEEGASTQIFLASSSIDQLNPGGYYDKCSLQKLNNFATDKEKATALWELSEQLTGSKFEL